MAINALWSKQTYEGSLGYPADLNATLTLWDGTTPVSGFAWFSSNEEEEIMQVVTTNINASFSAASDFEWEIGGVTYSIPMINLVEP